MVGRRLGFRTLAAALTLAATAAHGADYVPPPPPPPIYVPPPVIEEFSGWYLRGDIGFSNQNVKSLFSDNYAGYLSVTNQVKDFDAAPFFGVGIGYNLNDWLRFDVTGEYRGKANFHGLDIGVQPTSGGPANTPDQYSASKSEWTFLFNGYIDLGTWEKLTPFVGAGVGVSRNTISNFTDIGVAACGDPGVSGLLCTSNAWGDEHSQWSFAWALYGGLAYKVSRNVSIEFAYRYIDLGNAKTENITNFAGACCAYYEFRHLTSNDFKIGVRFNLDAFVEQPRPVYYAPPPPQYYPPPPVYTPPPPPLRSKG